jgi:dethiobiotin synthetase
VNALASDAPFDFDVSAWGPLPRRRGLFVTGAEAGAGATLIAGAVARSLRRAGKGVDVFKPAAVGCRRAGGQLVSPEAEFLAACAGSGRMLSEIAPVRYATAITPNVAAELEHQPVDLPLIFEAYKRIGGDWLRSLSSENGACPLSSAERGARGENGDRHRFLNSENGASPHSPGSPHSPFVVVEGSGGLLCPISDEFWTIHLARLMGLPIVVVARAGPGTINPTLLTLHVARGAGLRVAGVVLNRYLIEPPGRASEGREGAENGDRHRFLNSENGASPRLSASPLSPGGDVDMAMFTNLRQVEARGKVRVLALVPEDAENSIPNARIGRDTQFAIDQVNWEALADR